MTNEGSANVVMVVDDEVLVRSELAAYLRDCGYKVVEAASTDEAMVVVREEGFQLDSILCDINVGGSMNGFQFARWVRERRGLDVLLAGDLDPTIPPPSPTGSGSSLRPATEAVERSNEVGRRLRLQTGIDGSPTTTSLGVQKKLKICCNFPAPLLVAYVTQTMGVETMMRFMIAVTAVLATAGIALAEPSPVGSAASSGQGNLHAGHMATVATGTNTDGARYNTPSEEYHFGDGYRSGPGGWAGTRKNEAAEKK